MTQEELTEHVIAEIREARHNGLAFTVLRPYLDPIEEFRVVWGRPTVARFGCCCCGWRTIWVCYSTEDAMMLVFCDKHRPQHGPRKIEKEEPCD